jgi:hypothetical protein
MRHAALLRIGTLIALTPLIHGCGKPAHWFGCPKDSIDAVSMTDATNAYLHHILHNGQSLAAGEEATPIATRTPSPYGNVRFERGITTWSGRDKYRDPTARNDKGFELLPLQPEVDGEYYGETIANGMTDHLSAQIEGQGGKTAALQHRFLFSYHGQGNRLIRELDKRHDDAKDPRAGDRKSIGSHYITGLDDVRRAQQQAQHDCQHYSVAAVTWMQGEANGDLQITRWEPAVAPLAAFLSYMDDLIKLAHDYNDDIRVITGQRETIPFLTYQTSTYPVIAQAQLAAADAEPLIYLVSPTYYLPSAANGFYWIDKKKLYGHDIHLAADGERWLGEQFAKVLWQISVDKKDWQPLRPVSATVEDAGKAIRVAFHVPTPPLVLDQEFLPTQRNGGAQGNTALLGFEVLDQKDRAQPLESIVVADDTSVKITLRQPLVASGAPYRIRYGSQSATAFDASVIRAEPATDTGDGYRTRTIVVATNVVSTDAGSALEALSQEGAFYLVCDNQPRLLIRSIEPGKDLSLHADVTNGDLAEPAAQLHCHGERIYGFGNLRDSDPAISFYQFAHGPRKGQRYPLYNWSVVFDQLKVAM